MNKTLSTTNPETDGWRTVHDGDSLAMMQSPDGRIFRIQQLGKGDMWGNADDNDELIESLCGNPVTPSGMALAKKALVITDAEMGIYLGGAMGLGFWSILDPVGQPSAVTFPSEDEAEQFMASWDSGRPPGAVLVAVYPDDIDGNTYYASIDACVAAGLKGWSFDTMQDPVSKVRLIGKPDEWVEWNISQNLTDRWGHINNHNAANKPLETLSASEGYLTHLRAQMWDETTFIVRKDGRYGILFKVEFISMESEGEHAADYGTPPKPHAEMIKIINDSTLEKLTPNFPGVEFAIPHEGEVCNDRPALWAFVADGLLNAEQREALGLAMLNL